MEEFRTVGLDPATVTEADLAAVHAVLAAAHAVDRPRDPEPPISDVRIRVRNRRADRRFLHYLATSAGTPAGVATLWLSDVDNLHMGLGNVTVHPAYRRRGLGTDLLRTVAAATAAEGRTVLLAESIAGTAGAGFPGPFGAQLVAADRLSLLRLADVDGAEVERWATATHPGYRLETHVGALPEHRLESYARAKTAMNDAPTDDADVSDWVFTAETIRDDDKVAALLGEQRRVLALHEGTDEVAGFTELLVQRGRSRAQQQDTAVVPAHRGHGLGLWIKAAMLAALPAAHPEVTEIITGNAASNAHMLAINDRLGFRPWSEIQGWQFDVADLTGRLG